MAESDLRFEQYLKQAEIMPFSGWDFSAMANRWLEDSPTWDYRQLVAEQVRYAKSLLDMGTGGGEFLAGLQEQAPLPSLTCATEAYPPNVPIARARLEPLGVQVVQHLSDDQLPFDDAQFDLVINRHESYSVREVWRILKPGGIFLTQQVGAQDCIRLNELLQENAHLSYAHWTLDFARSELQSSGFHIRLAREEFPRTWFRDIGAVVYYLKAIPWQIPDFDIHRFHDRLYDMYCLMEAESGLHLTSHRFILEARKAD